MQKEADARKIIDKYSDTVYRIALTRCGSVENAEDVYQEVFVKYFQTNPKFNNEEHEKAWFIRVTINLSKNNVRLFWNKNVSELDENIIFESKEENDVFNVVNTLPQNYKTVIYLSYYEGYKVKEIADFMKVKEGTVKTWLFRAREILRKKLIEFA